MLFVMCPFLDRRITYFKKMAVPEISIPHDGLERFCQKKLNGKCDPFLTKPQAQIEPKESARGKMFSLDIYEKRTL